MMVSVVNMLAALALSLCVANAFQGAFGRRTINRVSMISEGRTPFFGGNWKLNPLSVKQASDLAAGVAAAAKGLNGVNVCVFPPMPFLVPVNDKVKGSSVKLGGQDCYYEDSGAFTGATATAMLKDVGAEYVLVGHSERRSLFGDCNDAVNRKVKKVLKEGLKPVLCIGETQAEYEAGLNQEVCAIQIMQGLKDITAEQMAHVVFAYEPVWAIGTGLVCPSNEAQDIHKYIRSLIAKKYGKDVASRSIIQYGGSVKPDNVKELMSMPDIDGALVGGASLTVDSFSKIIGYQNL